jgi:outer membrane protein assembly factor BamD
MLRRGLIPVFLLTLLVAVGCANKKVQNPLADVGSKQPDKVLFDRAMDALKHNHYDVARITLQTLINTYPDSEYIARAKLAVGDSWYAEGGQAALTQAEIEYKDFITFFPNMPEAAEAQLKIANIHYAEMEKPDRDFTHAERAEEEYRQLILQFPDSKLVPKAKERLREVQEVLAEREFRIGKFYYMRQSYPASIARLKSLVERYPLYSKADEALFMLGNAYEGEAANIRRLNLVEAAKGKLIKEFTDGAADAYSRIITRYPVMGRADDAKRRLEALHRPVPKPTKEALAQNKAEEESRLEPGHMDRVMANFRKRPDVSEAAHVGEPSLVDPKPVSATEVLRQATDVLKPGTASGDNKVAGEVVKSGVPGPSQPTPRSDAPPNTGSGSSTPATGDATTAPAAGSTTMNSSSPAETGIQELTPNTNAGAATPAGTQPAAQPATAAPAQGSGTSQPAADASQVSTDETKPAEALPQVNEAANPNDSSSSSSSATANSTGQSASSASNSGDSSQSSDDSTSKKKKKKGLGKLNPF